MITKLERIRNETINNFTTKRVFVRVQFDMLTHLKNTKMIKFLPEGSLHFWGVSIMKVVSLLMLMKMMWQVHLL